MGIGTDHAQQFYKMKNNMFTMKLMRRENSAIRRIALMY